MLFFVQVLVTIAQHFSIRLQSAFNMSRNRSQSYLIVNYGWTAAIRYLPFEYKVGNGKPDSFHTIKRHTLFTALFLILTLVNSPFVLYLYLEAVFAQKTTPVFLVCIGISFAVGAANITQWAIVIPATRLSLINAMNATLGIWFENSLEPTAVYEMICSQCAIFNILYQFLTFPIVVATNVYLPDIF